MPHLRTVGTAISVFAVGLLAVFVPRAEPSGGNRILSQALPAKSAACSLLPGGLSPAGKAMQRSEERVAGSRKKFRIVLLDSAPAEDVLADAASDFQRTGYRVRERTSGVLSFARDGGSHGELRALPLAGVHPGWALKSTVEVVVTLPHADTRPDACRVPTLPAGQFPS